MQNQASLQETKQHGAVRFPFNLYPCTIPGDFQQVALHWHESMELVFVKQGMGLVQVGVVTYPAYRGDIFLFAPGTLHALRQAEGQRMEYENIIFEPELLGGAEDLCAEKYLLPLQSGRLSLPVRLTPNDLCYLPAGAGGCQPRQAPRLRAAGKRGAAALSCPAHCAGQAVSPHRNCRHPAAENRAAVAFGTLCRTAPGSRCRRGLLLQCQPFYALVPADDRAELYCLSERVPAEHRRRSAANHR